MVTRGIIELFIKPMPQLGSFLKRVLYPELRFWLRDFLALSVRIKRRYTACCHCILYVLQGITFSRSFSCAKEELPVDDILI